MSTSPVLITGAGCLTPLGIGVQEFATGLTNRKMACAVHTLPAGCRHRNAVYGLIPDFSGALAGYAKPALRRKMSHLSRMAVVAAGLALDSANLRGQELEQTGISFGTAFGSTGQSETFFLDFLEHGPVLVNPGLFPETVPNAPAGQISLAFGLQGPNLTVCQQHLSSELALQQAKDMLVAGMAERMLVVGAEEISAPLLKGFDALGILKKETEMRDGNVALSARTMPGEAAVALVLETPDSAARRGATILALLEEIVTHGGAVWPARFGETGAAVAEAYSCLQKNSDQTPDLVVAGATFVDTIDRNHLACLATLLSAHIPVNLPELAMGNVLGAGLVRVLAGILALGGQALPAAPLGKALPRTVDLANDYALTSSPASRVLTSAVSAGGGAGMVLLAR